MQRLDVQRVFHSRAHENAVYGLMHDRIDCGPFDGGCLVFAQALQRLHGGEVVVVEGRCFSGWARFRVPEYEGELLAQHAVLRLPGEPESFMDASGVCSMREMLSRTAESAKYCASADAIRALRPGDLPDAPTDESLVADLTQLLAQPNQKAPRPRM